MAPPFHSNDDAASSAQSIYTFPPPSSASTMPPFSGIRSGGGGTGRTASKLSSAPTATTTATSPSLSSSSRPPPVSITTKPHYICSPIPAMAASFNLRRRLLLPTFVIPAMILSIPPLVVSVLTVLAYHATHHPGSSSSSGRGSSSLSTIIATSSIIIGSTWFLAKMGFSAIARHAPSEITKKRALAQSSVALPFGLLVFCTVVVRIMHWALFYSYLSLKEEDDYMEGRRMVGWLNWGWGLLTTTLFWTIKIAGACFGPALGWAVMSILVVCRFTGPFCPIVRCSSTPLQTNPFDATLQRLGRNFTSKTRFLDMIADGLEKLSAPSASVDNKLTTKPGNGAQPTNGSKNQVKSTIFATGMSAGSNATAVKPTKSNNSDSVGRPSSNARYSRPRLLSIMVQVIVNAVGGHIFAQAFVLPHLVDNFFVPLGDTVVVIIWLSCLLVPVFELFSTVKEAELHYKHYSSVVGGGSLAVGSRGFHLQPVLVALAKDVISRVQRSILGVVLLAPIIASATILLMSHLGPLFLGDSAFALVLPSYAAVLQSLLISYAAVALLVSIMAVQEVITRWAVCTPGMDADVLMFQILTTTLTMAGSKFLAEDLFVQSILVGDGATVDKVITPPGAKSNQTIGAVPFTNNYQEDEITRNEIASASFAEWIKQSSAVSSGLSDDILRMCLLESLGGGGSSDVSCPTLSPESHSFCFGNPRHSAAVRKRLDLSAATASPGQQPIVVPIVRALCAFAGGVGDAMSTFYRRVDKDGKPLPKNNSAELWKLPPGSLNAAEYAIIGAARLVVMNSVMIDRHGRAVVNASKRHDRISLLLPCVLQSAYKLRCGIYEYARATANMYEVNLSTYDTSGQSDGGLGDFISAKCPDLCPVISACNDSAKMAMKTLVESGDQLEDLLLRRKWNSMRQWLVGLNCGEAPAPTARMS
ncbi:hypothetical protein ACHAXR_012139 [Thalassiosira sp. AJA248-18]